jgi:hypothetical protein
MVQHRPDEATVSRRHAAPAEAELGFGSRLVGFIVFDVLYRHMLLITATVGGALIGCGLDLTDRTTAWIIVSCGAALGALTGVAMGQCGPGRKTAPLYVWVVGSALVVLVWTSLVLALCVAIQIVLALAIGGWDVSPIGAVLGGAIGSMIGGVAEELWWRRRRQTSATPRDPEDVASADRPRDK